MTYINTAATTPVAANAYGILITVNTGFATTGTITVADARGTQAVITTPTVGSIFRYYGFQGAISVITSAICDITVSTLNRQGS